MDSLGKMSDEDFEKKNFFHVTETLPGIWSESIIDGKLVKCEAVRLSNEHVPQDPDPKWDSRHVQKPGIHFKLQNVLFQIIVRPSFLTG